MCFVAFGGSQEGFGKMTERDMNEEGNRLKVGRVYETVIGFGPVQAVYLGKSGRSGLKYPHSILVKYRGNPQRWRFKDHFFKEERLHVLHAVRQRYSPKENEYLEEMLNRAGL